MGLWSAIKSGVSKVVSAVGGALQKAGNWISEKVSKWSGNMKETAESTADKLGNDDSYDRYNASAEQVDRTSHVLSELSRQYKDEAREIEDEIVEAIDNTFTVVADELSNEDFDVSFVKREKNNIKKAVRNSIVDEISENLAIGNPEVEDILSMEKGAGKKRALKKYAYNVISDSIDVFTERLERSCKRVEDKIQEAVSGKISEDENELMNKSQEIQYFLQQYSEGTFDSEMSSVEPYNNIFVCNCIIDLLANK